MASRRAARVAQRIKQEASQVILYELRDPRLGLLTITRVDISSDLRHATICYSVLGDESARRTAQRGLESARGLVRTRIARSLQLREAPDIRFEFDPSVEKAIEMSKLIDAATADLPRVGDTPDEPESP
jgi:ribosome-binding factor A